MKTVKYFLIFLMLFSCGKDDKAKVSQVLESVENFLTAGKCEDAISKIGEITAQNKNALYIKLKASAYACRAGYSTSTFFGTDLSKIDATNLLSSFSTFSLSADFDGPGNSNYEDLQMAFDTLVYAGGIASTTNPTAAKRAAVFNIKEDAEINSFILYLSLVQLGKYVFHYGSSSLTGVKGAGGAGSPCFYSYSAIANLSAALAAGGGSCNDTGLTGHPDLTSGADIHVSRACEGVILFNTFRDALINVSTGAIGGGADLSVIKTTLDTLIGALSFNDDSLVTILSQSKCEADFNDAAGKTDLETYFGFIMETLHNKT